MGCDAIVRREREDFSVLDQVPGHMRGAGFALAGIWPYLVAMNKYSPLVSEFGSAEEESAYVEWLKRTVAESLADPRPPVPHDQVMAEVRAMLEAKKSGKKC